jgi:signal transduction histidine kinase/ligand-binding sensor domain-containing protein/DNA-binding response OmpR family regulator
MKLKITLVGILLLLMHAPLVYADGANMVFRRISMEDGLSNSQVKSIYKDSRGYLWVGTVQGLNRYDGFRFKQYFKRNGQEQSLPDNIVSQVFEDAEGTLWVQTVEGYCRMDVTTETFDSHVTAWMAAHGMKGAPAHIVADGRRNLWIDVDGRGCYYYDFSRSHATFVPYADKQRRLPRVSVVSITPLADAALLNYFDGTLVKVSASGRVLWVNRYFPEHGGDKIFYRTFVDRHNNLWTYTGEHTYLYTAATRQWRELPHAMVEDISQDRSGQVWLATDHEGLLIMNSDGQLLSQLQSGRESDQLPDNTIVCLHYDDLGCMWIGSYKCGLAYHYEGQTTFGIHPLGDVCTITEDRQGNWWCGTNDSGLMVYNVATGSVRNIPMAATHLGSNIIVSSLTASDGSLWFGTFHGGLARYRDGQFQVWRKQTGGLSSDNIWSLAELPGGIIAIGTLGGGLQLLNPNTGQFTTYDHEHGGLQDDYVLSLSTDNNGNLLVGTSQDFSILNLANRRITNWHQTGNGDRLNSPAVQQIYVDSRGLIWLATASGLNVLDRKADQLMVVGLGSLQQEPEIRSVTEDRQGAMWVATSQSVKCIRVTAVDKGWQFFVNSYNASDGLQSRLFNMRSIYTTTAGDIIVGGMDGINVISPQRIHKQPRTDHIIFSGLMIFDHSLQVGEKFNGHVILTKALNESRELTLGHEENAFTIELASSNLGVPENSRFQYRLRGFSDSWQLTAENQPNITFTNLAPGKYTLEVRLVDDNGRPAAEISPLAITIRPPFYLTVWAYLFYLLVICGILYWVYRWAKNRQDERLRQVEEEKQHELEQTRQLFFTNMGHELRTPLTLIVSPLPGIISKEMDSTIRGKLQLIERNARQLLVMVNQLLDFRKLLVSGYTLQLRRGDIIAFIQNACNKFTELSDKGIILTFYSSQEHFYMDFDSDKVEKIINNLLSNAFKFTPQGGRVDVSVTEKDHTTLVLKVADDGIGISDADKEHIFERFYQAQAHEHKGGSGIGLNLVAEFARLHGGTVEVSDNPGGGTVFMVTLPIRNGSAEGGEFVETFAPEAPSATPAPRPVMPAEGASANELLLVDDNEDFLEFMVSELTPEFRVVTAHNGVEALQKVEQHRPDVVLTDVMMPQMDGNQLCKLLKRDASTAAIPIMIFTARLSEENEIESRECGADDYITKPFNLELLKMRIRRLVSHMPVGSDGKIDPRISDEEITPMDQQMVQEATAYVEKNLDDPDLNVEMMSAALNMSRVSLYRHLVSTTGKTPSEFIRLIRLRHAEQLLMKSQLSISEIAYRVGFSSQRYFSKCYKDLYGYMPSQYKDRKE